MKSQNIKIGLAGCGALGGIIASALIKDPLERMSATPMSIFRSIPGYQLIGIAEIKSIEFNVPRMSFAELAAAANIIIEALPPDVVPELAKAVLPTGKTLMMLSAAALLRYPEILKAAAPGQIQITAGALAGIDAVKAYALRGVKSAKLISTKPPHALTDAPYLKSAKIDLTKIKNLECIFTGNAYEAAQGFPANTNVAATLAFACTRPGESLFDITVEIWADPQARGNSHKIVVETMDGSKLESDIFSFPSAENPKSSPQAAYAMLAHLQYGGGAFSIG